LRDGNRAPCSGAIRAHKWSVASTEVVIVGAGVIGCAIARQLAMAGALVTVLERGRIGGEASGAAAGMLGAQAEASDVLLARLGVESRRLYPETLAALEAETGEAIEYWKEGTLHLVFSDADEGEMTERMRWQRSEGMVVERLTACEARRLERAINPELRWAVLFPDDSRVDNEALTRAYGLAAARAGAAVREGVNVLRAAIVGGRVAGVETDQGKIGADVVVNAAGAWAATLVPEHAVPVKPIRGQMLALQALPPLFRHAVYCGRGYAVARRNGRLLLGSTREDVGFDERVTGAGVAAILDAACELSPAIPGLTFREAWAGLRPGSIDGLPIVGPMPGIQGYLVATGHYRSGILLAPLTAHLIAACIRGERPAWIDKIGPQRLMPARE
jgi:glycine oxidase